MQVDKNTVMLLHMNDGTFKDEMGHAIINRGVQFNTSTKKFGKGSAYFNGTTGYLFSNDMTGLNFGTSDFTIEWWEYKTVSNTNGSAILHMSTGFEAAWNMILGYKDNLVYMTNGVNTAWNIASARSLGDVVLNSWQHLAVVRKGSTFYTFRNGVQQDTWTSTLGLGVATYFTIGRYYTGYESRFMNGFIDELRISNIARWTNTFVPPIKPYSDAYSLFKNKDGKILTYTTQLDEIINPSLSDSLFESKGICNPWIVNEVLQTKKGICVRSGTDRGTSKIFEVPIDSNLKSVSKLIYKG